MNQMRNKEDDASQSDQSITRLYLLDIERNFNRKREQLYYRIQSYFRQSISSNYIKADDLHRMIDECEALKKQYLKCK